MREERVSVVVVGWPSRNALARRFAPGIVNRLLDHPGEFDLMIVSLESGS